MGGGEGENGWPMLQDGFIEQSREIFLWLSDQEIYLVVDGLREHPQSHRICVAS
ncbi:hypothetical protein KS4_29210 [Poriferisphaera corsica]|uniref:Uncharacterized protein n=1 Tax=Poriferisphaera corsica TaxID=2528020 RepID=A0A517YX94_9BACT|nr:hypothetical protein KS4_29210 [Poriferisphaera corsica]